MKYLKYRSLPVYLKVSNGKTLKVEIGSDNDIQLHNGTYYPKSVIREVFIKCTALEFNEAYETAKKEIEDFKLKTK